MSVIVATDNDFEQHLKTNENVVVKYFAGWCGSCRLMAPKFNKLSETEAHSNVTFLDVNAEENENARKLAGVNNLPFFATFKNGELQNTVFTGKIEKVEEIINQL